VKGREKESKQNKKVLEFPLGPYYLVYLILIQGISYVLKKLRHLEQNFVKVCITNPPESLTSAGCAPQFPPGCDCDPAADDPNASCSANSECVQCKCLPLGCDCDPQADDPNGFCPSGDICKVWILPVSQATHISPKLLLRTASVSPPSHQAVTVIPTLLILIYSAP
jgi:hypothetical protein